MVIGCLRLSDVSIICRDVNPRRTFLVKSVQARGMTLKFELIPTVKMETRKLIEGYFSGEFTLR